MYRRYVTSFGNLDYIQYLQNVVHFFRKLIFQLFYTVTKVAAFIIRRLFAKRSEPWNEVELFARWQSELPGKGDLYQVKRTMLRGIAVCTGEEIVDMDALVSAAMSPERQWHYLPVESIPTDPIQCFELFFSLKERWFIYELEPYLEHLVDASPNIISSTEVLIRHAKLISECRDGVTRTFYQKK
jgi:hypothetical protein